MGKSRWWPPIRRFLGDLRRLPRSYNDLVTDRALGIRTSQARSKAPIDLYADRTIYETITYRALSVLDENVPAIAEDHVCDVGCGKGRIVCHFALKGLRRVSGVEYDPVLAQLARTNAHNLKGKSSPISIMCGDAADQDYSDVSYAFFFNPFGPDTLSTVVQKLLASDRLRVIVYANPVHDFILSDNPKLQRLATFVIPYDVSTMLVHAYGRKN